MGFFAQSKNLNQFFSILQKDYDIYAPKRFVQGGRFSDTDCIRYGKIQSIEEVVFDQKSDYSFKEILLPISQTLFYFTEQQVTESSTPSKKAIIFLRSCDLHAVKRLDTMYFNNGPADYYYHRLREQVKFVLMECHHSFDNCFCVSMNTNKCTDYDLSIHLNSDHTYSLQNQNPEWNSYLIDCDCKEQVVSPTYVTENNIKVHIPDNLTQEVAKSSMWKQYDSRCIACGRCNFVCPTCTCFTMQDIFYSENKNVGERRRIWASCMVDGFTTVAGGGSYRKNNGERMRFKVLHKVHDFKERNGYHMCVGCGRCDDICPEYISFSHCINQLENAMEEVSHNDNK